MKTAFLLVARSQPIGDDTRASASRRRIEFNVTQGARASWDRPAVGAGWRHVVEPDRCRKILATGQLPRQTVKEWLPRLTGGHGRIGSAWGKRTVNNGRHAGR